MAVLIDIAMATAFVAALLALQDRRQRRKTAAKK